MEVWTFPVQSLAFSNKLGKGSCPEPSVGAGDSYKSDGPVAYLTLTNNMENASGLGWARFVLFPVDCMKYTSVHISTEFPPISILPTLLLRILLFSLFLLQVTALSPLTEGGSCQPALLIVFVASLDGSQGRWGVRGALQVAFLASTAGPHHMPGNSFTDNIKKWVNFQGSVLWLPGL